MKRVLAVIAGILMLFSLCSCSGKDLSVADTCWTLSGVDLGGIELTGTENLSAYGLSGSVVFSEDTFTLTLIGNEQSGTYTQKQDILTMNGSKPLFAVLYDDTLVIEDEDIGTLSFEKQ